MDAPDKFRTEKFVAFDSGGNPYTIVKLTVLLDPDKPAGSRSSDVAPALFRLVNNNMPLIYHVDSDEYEISSSGKRLKRRS